MFRIIILSREQYCLCLFRSGPIYIPLLLLLFHFIYIFRQQHFATVERFNSRSDVHHRWWWLSYEHDSFFVHDFFILFLSFFFLDRGFFNLFFLSLWMAQRAFFFNGKCRNVSTYPLFSPNKYTFSIIQYVLDHFSFLILIKVKWFRISYSVFRICSKFVMFKYVFIPFSQCKQQAEATTKTTCACLKWFFHGSKYHLGERSMRIRLIINSLKPFSFFRILDCFLLFIYIVSMKQKENVCAQ